MHRLFSRLTGALLCAGLLAAGLPAQAKGYTIALIPGLTTDAFYITMHKGAEAAAKAVGAELVFQGAPDFNPVDAGAGAGCGDRAQSGRDPDRADRQDAAHRAAEEGGRTPASRSSPSIPSSAPASTRPARATPTSRSPTSPPTTCSAAESRRARSPRRSATRARSMSPTSSPASRRPTSARKASRRR